MDSQDKYKTQAPRVTRFTSDGNKRITSIATTYSGEPGMMARYADTPRQEAEVEASTHARPRAVGKKKKEYRPFITEPKKKEPNPRYSQDLKKSVSAQSYKPY